MKKNNRGITLISLTMYVVGFAIIATIVATITSFFYSNVVELRDSTNSLGEFEIFNAAFLAEVKKKDVKVVGIENEGRKITFDSGTVFSFEQGEKGIYNNNVKICEGVEECIFSINKNTVKPTIRVYLEIGTDFAKTLEFVVNTDEINYEGKTGNINIIPNIKEWTNNDVTVKFAYEDIPDGYELQYKVENGEWVTGNEVAVSNNTVIQARLFNSTTNDEIKKNGTIVDNIDKESPTLPTRIVEVTKTSNNLQVQARYATDSKSGVAGYKYSLDKVTWSGVIKSNETYNIEYASVSTTTLPNGWESTKVATVVTEGTQKAPIPVGYTVSGSNEENNISEGLVIYQKDSRVIPTIYAKTVDYAGNESDIYILDNRENINQYVWIPVDDINDMVMCKQNGNTGTSGATTCVLAYNDSTKQITCNTHGYTTATALTDENIDTTGLAGRLYGVDSTTTDTTSPKIYTTNMAFTDSSKDSHKFSKTATYREPDIVTSFDRDDVTTDGDTTNDRMAMAGISTGLVRDFKIQLNNKFIEMASSVAKYGGFYISRFECGFENNKIISKKNKAVLTAAASASGNYLAGNMWYGLYNKTLNNVEKEESVNSHMIWGCQYDQVIKFLGAEAQTGHNYQTTIQVVTGYVGDQDILNNIYDLGGNNSEWTAQAYSTYSRVDRGGKGGQARASNFYPASYHHGGYGPSQNLNDTGTRNTLYLAI